MPSLKNILVRQTAVPMNFEKGIPMLPKVSQIMAQVASALPIDPVLPDIPVGAGAIPGLPVEGFTQVIKGVEDVLPAGTPKFSESIQAFAVGGFRPIEEKKPSNATHARRVLGGGYRSIT